jgi:hypothetical protein
MRTQPYRNVLSNEVLERLFHQSAAKTITTLYLCPECYYSLDRVKLSLYSDPLEQQEALKILYSTNIIIGDTCGRPLLLFKFGYNTLVTVHKEWEEGESVTKGFISGSGMYFLKYFVELYLKEKRNQLRLNNNPIPKQKAFQRQINHLSL